MYVYSYKETLINKSSKNHGLFTVFLIWKLHSGALHYGIQYFILTVLQNDQMWQVMHAEMLLYAAKKYVRKTQPVKRDSMRINERKTIRVVTVDRSGLSGLVRAHQRK